MIKVSLVIPTRNRAEDLSELLASISDQTVFPFEVLVVDDSDDVKTQDLVEKMDSEFFRKGIELRYLRGGGNSLAHARNVGASQMKGEIYCGVDDDVILARDYIEQIIKFHHDHPDAVGVQGNFLYRGLSSVFSNAVKRVLFSPCFQKDRSVVWAAGMTFPFPLTKTIRGQWLSGTNSSYKRQVLKGFKWDENLVGYSLCEDMDISYRILRKYPNSLYVTPYAKAYHKFSPVARITPESLIHMEVAYTTYFFFKNFRLTLPNMVEYVLSMFFGKFLLTIFGRDRWSIPFLISAYLNLFKSFAEVKTGNFSSFQVV